MLIPPLLPVFMFVCADLLSTVTSQASTPPRRIQLRNVVNNRYLRVLESAEGTFAAQAVISDRSDVPYLHGSTFLVQETSDGKWQLQAMRNGKWLCAENGGGSSVTASRDSPSGWESFGLSWVNGALQLQAFNGQWLGMSAEFDPSAVIAQAGTPSGWETFFVVDVPFTRGVNLGGWFVPEHWMVPSVYEGTNATDLCTLSVLPGANTKLRSHLNTFFAESDFDWMASQGLTSVRLPIGYWNVLGHTLVPGGPAYPPLDPSFSLSIIDQVFNWTAARGMTVLLDLHGAPGSQNDADHSGCAKADYPNGMGWDTSDNRRRSVQVIEALAERYCSRSNLFGFELLNEPGENVEQDHGDLLQYYRNAYNAVRQHCASAVVVFNELYDWEFGDWWNGQLTEPGYYNVVLDLHKYDCFGGAAHETTQQHVDNAYGWYTSFDKYQLAQHPVMVGEWSLATGDNPGGSGFAEGQLWSFTHTLGYYFWSHHLDHYDASWSLRDAIDSGALNIFGLASEGALNVSNAAADASRNLATV